MSKFDIVIAITLLVGTILGYKRGFLLELFFLIALILGVFIGFKLMSWGVEFLAQKFNADTAVLPYISFALIFIIVVVVVNFIGGRIKSSIEQNVSWQNGCRSRSRSWLTEICFFHQYNSLAYRFI
ncbi:MAG: CvpA family protein [Flammeovirgaceae bacterium]|nr:CvpA family protein [Flammeovirgaceae bacterium]